MSITIEKATPADAAAMIAYLKQVGGETDNLTFGPEGLPFTVEAEAAYIAQLERSRDSVMLAAKEEGRIVGNASLKRLPRRHLQQTTAVPTIGAAVKYLTLYC